MVTTRTEGARRPPPAPPRPIPHQHHYRAVDLVIQRSTVTGDWVDVALAESREWAQTVTAALNWLDHNPLPSEAV